MSTSCSLDTTPERKESLIESIKHLRIQEQEEIYSNEYKQSYSESIVPEETVMNGEDNSKGVDWLSSVSVKDLCSLSDLVNQDIVRGLFCLYGSWNRDLSQAEDLLRNQWTPSVRPGRAFVAGMVQVDRSDEDMEAFCGDNGCSINLGFCPPTELPALVAVVQDASKTGSSIQVIADVTAQEILQGDPLVLNRIKATFNTLILGVATSSLYRKHSLTPPPHTRKSEALRIFIAGDRANVGKTSVCLGILGSLVSMGYDPAEIAYIKPATQDESQQLLQTYCEKVGIRCVPLGPIVFYKGFTRAFLAGETESTADLLYKVSNTVKQLSYGKRVVVIDGVGYPAVGSICGTDNAAVARACAYSEHNPLGVIVVGPTGVGNAVDSYNLNASYFESRGVPVMGAIFNKLPADGYYSLENCKGQVSAYFRQFQPKSRTFGFIPLCPELAEENAIEHLENFFMKFLEHVDINGILESASKVQKSESLFVNGAPAKRPRISPVVAQTSTQQASSRQEIEARAKQAGAKDSC